MKKTFRKILAAVLAVLVLTGGLTAFAAEDKESIIYSSDTVLEYAGRLVEGENTVSHSSDYSYVEFTAEKDGYYSFMYVNDNWYSSNWLRSLEKQEDGSYYHDDSYLFYMFKSEGMVSFFELEAGEVVFRLRTEDDSTPIKIIAEYLGEEITDIDFSQGIDYPMISEYDFYPARYDAPGYSYYLYADDFVLTFDTGKTISVEDGMGLFFSSGTELTEGEYRVNVYFADKTFEKTVRVCVPETYITKIEAVDPEKFSGIEYYNGERSYFGCDVTYKVTFSNGETIQTGSSEYFNVPGMNRDAFIEREYVETENGAVVEIFVGNSKFAEYPCELRKADVSENFEYMKYECSGIFGNFTMWSQIYYQRIENASSKADKLRAVGVWVSYINNNFIYVLAEAASEFAACIAGSLTV